MIKLYDADAVLPKEKSVKIKGIEYTIGHVPVRTTLEAIRINPLMEKDIEQYYSEVARILSQTLSSSGTPITKDEILDNLDAAVMMDCFGYLLNGASKLQEMKAINGDEGKKNQPSLPNLD